MDVGRRAATGSARRSALGLVLLCTVLGWWLQVSPSVAAGPATSVSVKLAPASIVANGTSTTTVTATVTDATNAPVSGNAIVFSAAPGGVTFSAVTDHRNGTYTATVTGSTAIASVTITATDSSVTPNVLGQAELAQTAPPPPPPPPPLPATDVSLGLSPTSIVANGSSTSTATARVTNANGGVVSNDTIAFSTNDGGNRVSATTKRGNGIYTATITSSGTAHAVTVTARDQSAGISGSATLTQTAVPPLPAKTVSVSLSPASIVANGSSVSTATAAVTNANGGVVSNDTIAFSTNDGGNRVSATTNRGNGIYAATITSSRTVHSVTITATDRSANISGRGTLTQAAVVAVPGTPTATKLSSVPTNPVTNQQVTLIATVASSTAVAATGTISFVDGATPINGCANEPVTAQAPIVTCVTAFSASTSPALLTAVFVPSPGSSVGGSTSATDPLVVGRDSTLTTLSVPNGGIVKVGADITYSATVSSAHGGGFETGSVSFEDAGTPIPACAGQPLAAGGTATCTVSYATAGTHAITAVYLGDANFTGSASAPAQAVGVVRASAKVLGIIGSTMQWTFFYTPSYTKVLALAVNSAPIGATVVLQCKGGGCPFAKRSLRVRKPKPCKRTSKHKCRQKRSVTIHLMPRFHNHHLSVGARIMVRVVRSHWIGKYYSFVMRARQAPKVEVECLAPGSSRPGVGC
jgi:adhesin/invasin